ncbi:hypothetical protein HK098_002132 [Nowakowskiella sp. JEL0407]|nr:hypothetical protein HK098_002132 [Nowakowskiella sp. JEL0407]
MAVSVIKKYFPVRANDTYEPISLKSGTSLLPHILELGTAATESDYKLPLCIPRLDALRNTFAPTASPKAYWKSHFVCTLAYLVHGYISRLLMQFFALALTKRSQSAYNEALILFTECVEIRETVYCTRNHAKIAAAIYELGSVYPHKGNYVEAKRLLVDCISIFDRVHATREHFEVAEAICTVGSVAQNQGKFEEAAKLYYEILISYKEAKKLYTKSLIIQEKVYGTREHANVATTIRSLAALARSFDEHEAAKELNTDYEEAVSILAESLAISELVHNGRNNWLVANILILLGVAQERIGNLESAKSYYRMSFEAQAETDSAESSTTLFNLLSLDDAGRNTSSSESRPPSHVDVIEVNRKPEDHEKQLLIPFAIQYSAYYMFFHLVKTLQDEYLPFILMVGSLYIVAGGIVLEGKLSGTPLTNTLLFIVSIPLCYFFGTTGASMLLIRPLLRSISHRVHDAHTVVFFIFLVSNVIGSLTPDGNPPLFIGFLKGVDFFWPLINVSPIMFLTTGYLLIFYFCLDTYFYRKEQSIKAIADVENADNADKELEKTWIDGDVINEENTPKQSGAGSPASTKTVFRDSPLAKTPASKIQFIDNDLTPLALTPSTIQVNSGSTSSNPDKIDDEEMTPLNINSPADILSSPTMTIVGNREDDGIKLIGDEEDALHVEKQRSRWLFAERMSKKGEFRVRGWRNVFLIVLIAGIIIASGYIQKGFPDAGFVLMDHKESNEEIFYNYASLARDILMLVIPIVSFFITPARILLENNFTWSPLIEVAILFLHIFITLAPILIMFEEGTKGALGVIITSVTQPWHFFWMSGIMSSFLDNAPTYLLFFNSAGGNAAELMTTKARILMALTAGSCFFGGVTYIGNAPNLLIKNIAENNGVKMPSFPMYIVWAVVILFPIFLIDTVIFFR